jgi:N-acetylglutamate synthase-like GNAT family acetyltransferase
MGDPFGLEVGREWQKELLREAEERRIARALRRSRRGDEKGDEGGPAKVEGVEVRWGRVGDEPAIADLLELNGMPRWLSLEVRFVVAERSGKVLGAVRYGVESKRLILGLLVVDPWAGEERMASALYRGAGGLAREIGAHEVVASASRARYPALAGYRRRGRGWRLAVERQSRAGGGRSPLRGRLKS